MELSEVVTAIGTFVGGDKAKAKEVAEAIRNDSNAKDVSQHLINLGNSGKTAELQPKIKKLEEDLKAATDTLAERDTEIGELKTKTPDAKTIEDKVNATWQKKFDAEKKRADDAAAGQKTLRREVAKKHFTALLKKADAAGLKVEDDWADRVVAAEFDDRFVDRDDGSLDVLQIGETTAYDGKTVDEKIAALAADARKKVNTRYLITSTDSGGGVGGGGGGGGGAYDPEKAGKELAKQQKATAPEKNLAFQ